MKDRPLPQNGALLGQPGWNCVFWVKEALEMLKADPKALGTSVVEWEKVRSEAMGYCQRKKDQHRLMARATLI
jgi:hypothetical protein